MFALICAGCGLELDVNKADHDRGVVCPRCGKSLTDLQATQVHNFEDTDNDETISPSRSDEVLTFPFLAPAAVAGELGQLAHYRVVRLLGQGGMGIVFEAIDTQLQRTIALKVMKPDIARDPQARKRFLREARTTASVRSDHIVVIHEVGTDHDLPFIAMEFLRGESLERCLENQGRPSLADALQISLEITQGLAAAHDRGLIHRDIKPANIWLEDIGSGISESSKLLVNRFRRRVKILDFGLARTVRENTNLTKSGMVLGTPAYMAPEQAEGGGVDGRSDLFSLGCVLYELTTGSKPFVGPSTMAILMAVAFKPPPSPSELNPALPPALCKLMLQLMAKKPEDRPASAEDVAEELSAIIANLQVPTETPMTGIARGLPARSTSMMAALPRRNKPWKIWLVLGGVLAACLGVWAIAALYRNSETELLVGMSGPFSGPSKELGRQMALGINLYFRHINDQGGVHGRKLKLIALDDGYEPAEALANMKELREKYKVFAALGNIGTPTAAVTVPYAVENKMLFFGAFTGARLLREDPPQRYVFNYRASYEEETAKIVEYLVEISKNKVKPEEIAVFDQNDPYGDAGFAGVVKVMRDRYKRQEKDIVRVRFERNTIHVHDAVETILKHPELRAVVIVGTYKPAVEFIRQLRDAKSKLTFAAVSFVGSEALAEGLKDHGSECVNGVIVTQVVPPIDSRATVVLRYRELLQKYYPNERPSFTSLEGYIASAIFVEGLQRAGPNPTTEKMIDTLESIHDFDIGTGARLGFSKSEHQASHKVWGTILDESGRFNVLEMH